VKLEALLDRARRRTENAGPLAVDPALDAAAAASAAYLASDAARRDLARDPYWPKWTSPWWHLVLLHELGLAGRIPAAAAGQMAEALDRHFLHSFPFRLEDVPAGVDPYRHIVCHCALGTMFRLLCDCGIDVDARVPWAREWFLRYQLPDGGLNCDEGAYVRETPRSSFVSTLPPAEALLFATPRPFDARERAFLAGVAEYLSKRALVRSLSRGRVIDASWLVPAFPRFYFYDALRGLRFLAHYAHRTGSALRADAIAEPVEALARWFEGSEAPRQPHLAPGTLAPDESGGWKSAQSCERFALLDRVGPAGAGRRRLDEEWCEVLELLAAPGAVAR
jgi:hypothetical protein